MADSFTVTVGTTVTARMPQRYVVTPVAMNRYDVLYGYGTILQDHWYGAPDDPRPYTEARAAEVEALRIRAEEEHRKREAARMKARELLMLLLKEPQREQFVRYRSFDVIGGVSGDRYSIVEGFDGNVMRYTRDGKFVAQYCCRPEGIPMYDVLLAQKLAIEHNESEFTGSANVLMTGVREDEYYRMRRTEWEASSHIAALGAQLVGDAGEGQRPAVGADDSAIQR